MFVYATAPLFLDRVRHQTWGYEHLMPGMSSTPPSDTGVVCDWPSESHAAADASAMPACRTAECDGHGAFDVLPWTHAQFASSLSLSSSGGGGAAAHFTNIGFYNWTAPNNPDLPYTYDNFAWHHCAEQGYEFF